MNAKEKELVSEEFIKENTNYNLKIGGDGGWDYVNELMKDDNFRSNFIQSVKDEYASRCKDKKLLQNKKILKH